MDDVVIRNVTQKLFKGLEMKAGMSDRRASLGLTTDPAVTSA